MGGAVPLSEHEQRQLDAIERALYAEDPKFAQAVRAKDPRVHYKRRVIEAAIGFLLGVGLLLAGVISKLTVVGVAGFVVMLACSMWALSSWRHMSGGAVGRGAAARGPLPRDRRMRSAARPRAKASFMERMEERWRRRQERDR
jgi:Protein of unknown function (DUF3040)